MGVILYALLCGELPFDEEDEMKTRERIIKQNYKLPEYLSPGVYRFELSNSRRKISDILHPRESRRPADSGKYP